MKRILMIGACIAATLAGATAASAQPYRYSGGHDRHDRYERYDRHDRYDRYDRHDRRDRRDYRDYRRWSRGQYLPPAYRGYVVRDYGRYRLRPPPRGYHWVRAGDDYILAAIATGLILEVFSGYR